MLRRSFLAALAATALAAGSASAQETVKVGLIIPLTGPFTTTGKQLEPPRAFISSSTARPSRQEDRSDRQVTTRGARKIPSASRQRMDRRTTR
jgi:hypothetical protein